MSIELIHLQKSYGDFTPLEDVNARIEDGEVIAIIGPSGCGKSTLIRCIALLDPPTGGKLLLDGEDVCEHSYDQRKVHRKTGMVFQRFNLFKHWTALQNIMQPQIDLLGRSKSEAYDIAMAQLRKFALEERALAFPSELSGGQQQRVAIARCLAMDPQIVIMDEPTSALDPAKVDEMKSIVLELAAQGKTLLIVTHEMAFARSVASRIFYMDEGRIYEEGSPEQIFEHPQRPKTRSFIMKLRELDFSYELHNPQLDLDLNFASTSIRSFASRWRMEARLCSRLESVFEELCASIIAPWLRSQDCPGRLQLRIEYHEEEGSASICAQYDGPSFDPRLSSNELALLIVEGNAQEISFNYDGSDFGNRVLIKLKQA